jgi:transcriptional regulator with XRE-family HTH domain
MDLGHRVRDLRNARHLSQIELAARAGVARNTLNRIENGHLMPTAPVIEHLAEALNVAPGVLFEETGLLAGKAKAPQETGPSETEDERRIAIDYGACRAALEAFCDHWLPVLSGKRRLEHQAFEDFKAYAASLARLVLELMGAEKMALGQQYDEEGYPVFYTERSEFGPAILRFDDLVIRMDRIGKEQWGEDLTSDPKMAPVLELVRAA